MFCHPSNHYIHSYDCVFLSPDFSLPFLFFTSGRTHLFIFSLGIFPTPISSPPAILTLRPLEAPFMGEMIIFSPIFSPPEIKTLSKSMWAILTLRTCNSLFTATQTVSRSRSAFAGIRTTSSSCLPEILTSTNAPTKNCLII